MTDRDELFRVDPSEFVARRDALARTLRQQGERDAAAEVKALRRPSLALWALNQVARDEPHVVQAVLDASDAARGAQADALGGGDASALRAAIVARRGAMRRATSRLRRATSSTRPAGRATRISAISTTRSRRSSRHLRCRNACTRAS